MSTLLIFIRKSIYWTLSFINVFAHIEKPEITVLCYHSISNDGWRFSTKINDFKKHIKYLMENYDFISINQLERYFKGAYTPKRPSILLTFDDGYKNILNVEKFLNQHSIKPTVFVLSDPKNVNRIELDTNLELLSNKQMNDLSNDGWEIGSHSKTHQNFYDEGVNIFEELNESKKQIEKVIKKKVKYFAYPKGKYSKKIVALTKKSGYRLGFSMDDEFITQRTNQYIIPRVGIDGTHSVDEFKLTIQPLSILFRKFVRSYLKINI